MIVEDTVVYVRGRIEKSDDDAARLVALEVSQPDLSEAVSGPLVITLPVAKCVPNVIEPLKDVLRAHPGTTEVRLRLVNGSRETLVRIDDRLRVTNSTALSGDLKALLGAGCLA